MCIWQCNNCDSSYIGETGRQFKTRLGVYKKNVDSIAKKVFTRSERKLSQTVFHKSAMKDQVAINNHVIDWEKTPDSGQRERPTHHANSGGKPDPAPPRLDEAERGGGGGGRALATFTILCLPSFPIVTKGSNCQIVAQCQWSSEQPSSRNCLDKYTF